MRNLLYIKNIMNRKASLLFIISVLIVIGLAICSPIILLLNKRFIDSLALKNIEVNNSIKIIICYICIQLLSEILENIKNHIDIIIQFELDNNMQKIINEKVKNIRLEFFENTIMYDYIERVSTYIVPKILDELQIILGIISPILNLATFSYALIWIKWYFPIILILMNIPYLFFWKKKNDLNFNQYKKLSQDRRYSDYWMKVLFSRDYVKEIKLFELYSYIYKKWKKIKSKIYIEEKGLINKIANIGIIIQGTRSLSMGICLGITAIMVCTGETEIGTYVFVYGTITSLNTGITTVIGQWGSIGELLLLLDDWKKFLEFEEENTSFRNKIAIETITFRNVSFKYPNCNDYILDNVSITIRPGEKIAIVGENGSGKTTFINLLLGLYCPVEGKILIGNNEIFDVLYSYRENISCIFQDYIKLQSSVKENIFFGNLYEETKSIIEMVNDMKINLDDKLGQLDIEGRELSGGEWQRLAILRCLSQNRNIIIMDEPTASLDPLSENKYMEEIEKKSYGKTLILITHKLSVLQLCDRILLLKKGKILEDGNYNELYKKKGDFYELLQNQSYFYKKK